MLFLFQMIDQRSKLFLDIVAVDHIAICNRNFRLLSGRLLCYQINLDCALLVQNIAQAMVSGMATSIA